MGVAVGIGVGVGIGVAVGSGVGVGVGTGVAVGSGVGVTVGGIGVGGVVVRLTSDAQAAMTNSNTTIANTTLGNFIPKTPINPKSKISKNRTQVYFT